MKFIYCFIGLLFSTVSLKVMAIPDAGVILQQANPQQFHNNKSRDDDENIIVHTEEGASVNRSFYLKQIEFSGNVSPLQYDLIDNMKQYVGQKVTTELLSAMRLNVIKIIQAKEGKNVKVSIPTQMVNNGLVVIELNQ